ncbi:MAG: benzoate-CoA ligase family protein [bacterium]|nr:benzoate-CoA ligase family protein [bacterium]
MAYTAHVDTFARDNLPPADQMPEFIFELPELHYPDRLNCAAALLDGAIARGWGDRIAIIGQNVRLTYRELNEQANQVARFLLEDWGLVPGNRVLLRGPNTPMLAVTWFGAVKAGLVVVATMAMLREKELNEIVQKAQITAALCDKRFAEELHKTAQSQPMLAHVCFFNGGDADSLEAHMAQKPITFNAVETAADDVVAIAFTSGTTGKPKGTMHYHRDMLAICDCFPKSTLKITMDDRCIGTPPLAFTFGLGGSLLFPLRVGASTILLESYTPESMLNTIREMQATITFTSPFFYRKMAELIANIPVPTLHKCVSAGEALPAATRQLWKDTSGIDLIDGIGATEMLHIFISHTEADAKAGATGKPIPGYHAKIVDFEGNEVPQGQPGRLAVKGPTGCRYLADARQTIYVQNGWNLTGDTYLIDVDGYFVYQARSDDMIISAGYNIAGPEVEEVLMRHPAVAECVVVGAPDPERGTIVKAYVVVKPGTAHSDELVSQLQDHVKNTIAPYKYPRAIEFITELPRTNTGKVQRFVLRDRAWQAGKQQA